MTRVEVASAALAELDLLIRTHSLPGDTRERVRSSLLPLKRFPRLGRALEGPWRDYRFLLGPWRWMLIVYAFDEAADRVVVVTFEDARNSTAATSAR